MGQGRESRTVAELNKKWMERDRHSQPYQTEASFSQWPTPGGHRWTFNHPGLGCTKIKGAGSQDARSVALPAQGYRPEHSLGGCQQVGSAAGHLSTLGSVHHRWAGMGLSC